MKSYEKIISSKFNRAHLTYDQHAGTQIAAGEHLIHMLARQSSQFQNILDAGCGTGIITRSLADTVSYESFKAIDIAELLLRQAKLSAGNIHYVHENFNDLKENAYFDLIFANMALHWSRSLILTLNIFHRAMANHGILAFTLPLEGTFAEIPAPVSTHEFLNAAMVTNLLPSLGFRILSVSYNHFTASFPDAISALRSIKHTGASHVRHATHKSLRGKSHFNHHSSTDLSYVIGFFIAEKIHD